VGGRAATPRGGARALGAAARRPSAPLPCVICPAPSSPLARWAGVRRRFTAARPSRPLLHDPASRRPPAASWARAAGTRTRSARGGAAAAATCRPRQAAPAATQVGWRVGVPGTRPASSRAPAAGPCSGTTVLGPGSSARSVLVQPGESHPALLGPCRRPLAHREL
jgi:hypothetical protein